AGVAFGQALSEGGEWELEVLGDLANAATCAHADDLATRANLELALRDPTRAEKLVSESFELLDVTVARLHGDWIVDEWYPRIRELINGSAAGKCALLAGQAALLRGNARRALELFDEGAERGVTPELARMALEQSPLEEADPWTLARARARLGLTEEALATIDAMLSYDEGELELSALMLKAELLESSERKAELPAALLSLGLAFDVRERYADAIRAFERLVAVDPRNPVGWWYLADSRRLAALTDASPSPDVAALKQARKEWATGLAIGVPTPEQAWVHLTGSLLIESFGAAGDETAESLWQAVLQAEQAMALAPGNNEAWTHCARQHRFLMHPATAIITADQAVLPGAGPQARIGQIAVHASVGTPDTDRLIELATGRVPGYEADLHSLRGFARLLAGDVATARMALDDALALQPDALWSRHNRALVAALQSDAETARADAAWLMEATGSTGRFQGVKDRRVRGIALIVLERYDDAAMLLRELIDNVWADSVKVRADLAAVELLRGHATAAAEWMASVSEDATQLAQVCHAARLLDLAESRGSNPGLLRDTLDRTLERLAGERYDSSTARGELGAARSAAAAGTTEWIVASAALARICVGEGAFADAAQLYECALPYSDPVAGIPAAREALIRVLREHSQSGEPDVVDAAQSRLVEIGAVSEPAATTAVAESQARTGAIETALETLRTVARPDATADVRIARMRSGDLLLASDRVAEARAVYESALAAARAHGGEKRELATLEARLGVLDAREERLGEAAARLRSAVRQLDDTDTPGTAENVIMYASREVLGLDEEPPWLAAVLRGLAEDRQLETLRRRRLSSARFSELRNDARHAGRRVSRVLIETAPELLTDESQSLLKNEVPTIRERLRSVTGVRVPGVQLRASKLLPRAGYRLLLDEIPHIEGIVPPRAQFAIDPEAALDAPYLRNPFSGQLGRWLDPAAREAAGRRGVNMSPAFAGVLWQLEGLLRVQLSRFLGLDEIEYLLGEWEGEADGRRALIARALPNKGACVRLTVVLRALVRGHIPIDDLGSILQAMELPSDGPWTDALAERARSSLQRSFADVVDGRKHVAAPESLERALLDLDVVRGGVADRLDLRAEMRACTGDYRPGEVFLVVSNAESRPRAQHLLESVWPSGAVLSAPELDVLIGASERTAITQELAR
ncbi:MAG: FHIPEP family type III secretion protein, partial [Gaiellaceae bacterium]